mgnify:CR=1 FL=1
MKVCQLCAVDFTLNKFLLPLIDGHLADGNEVIAVCSDGEYIKELGRKSELINVGGEKVYPAEVESVIHEFKNVRDVIVYGERNAIIGNAVCAKISLLNDEDHKNFVIGLKKHCNSKLENGPRYSHFLTAEPSIIFIGS